MTEQLEVIGVAWQRVPAFDGRTLGPLPWPDYDRAAYDSNWGKSHNPNELGCYLSHIKALRAFLASNHEFALILEDDALIRGDLIAVLNSLVAIRSRWDVVKLAGIHWAMPVTVQPLPGAMRLVAFLQRNTGSAAYVVNRRAATAYVRHLLPMSVPYDHAFDQVWRYGLRMRGVLPFPIGTAGSSTINVSAALGRKKPWYRRASVLWYRTRTETMRVANYLFRDPVALSLISLRRGKPAGPPS
jgi:glycosyl transferase family 25